MLKGPALSHIEASCPCLHTCIIEVPLNIPLLRTYGSHVSETSSLEVSLLGDDLFTEKQVSTGSDEPTKEYVKAEQDSQLPSTVAADSIVDVYRVKYMPSKVGKSFGR
ncbi:unnamed protein product [Protopolystoma xenopodis]|uniref:Uncharacterized protein n=1 Tax=Protopolystoma xenopodis TaxID=117903 RepID=A0A3S5AGC6_9PLAT|nr:unnamed protein product [Protopolystoma xenopodis]